MLIGDYRILIIEGERELYALIKHSVQSENIDADFCNSGKEGLSIQYKKKLKEVE